MTTDARPRGSWPTLNGPEDIPERPWRRTLSKVLGRPQRGFQESWELVRAGQAPALHPSVRSPAVRDSRHRLRAAYTAMPILEHLHRALPEVVVEGSSVDIADHLDGDYWPDQRLIRLECHHPIDVIAFTILHEFGHAVDHLAMSDGDRARLGHPQGLAGWRSDVVGWHERGEEWLAESFAHWWWPQLVEARRPAWRLSVEPLDPAIAKRLFDPNAIARRAAGQARRTGAGRIGRR